MIDIDAFMVFPDRDQPFVILDGALPAGALALIVRRSAGASHMVIALDGRPWGRVEIEDRDAEAMLGHAGARVVHGAGGDASRGRVRNAVVTQGEAGRS